MSASEKALERLQKLLTAQEHHTRHGNMGEAAAAANLIQELLTRYKIELTDVERARDEAANPMMFEILYPSGYGADLKKHRVEWTEHLQAAVAFAYYCKDLCTEGYNLLWLVGQKRDVEIATGVFYRLARTALALCERDREAARKRAYRGGYRWIGNKEFRTSFLFGFTDAVSRKLYEKRVRLEIEAGNCQALIHTQDAVERYAKEVAGGKQADALYTPRMDFDALKQGMIRGTLTNIEGADLESAPEYSQLKENV